MSAYDWPEDVPAPADPSTWEDEVETLAALARDAKRRAGIEEEPPPPAVDWTPDNPIAARLWTALPIDGRGVEYVRTLRAVAGSGGWPLHHVQVAMVGLVLAGKAYCTPAEVPDVSLVGRGNDPRTGAATYRTGAVTL